MKNLIIIQMKKIPLLMVFLTLGIVANAQSRYLPKEVTDFSISIQNLTQPTDRTIEFDVYLLDKDATQTFELGGVQLGFLFNSLIYSGGSISGSYNNTNSGLFLAQQPTANVSFNSSVAGYPNQTLLRLASRTPPGNGNGTIISSTFPGTLVTHFTLTSTVPWTAESRPNFVFNSSSVTNPLYPTVIGEYISGTNTSLLVSPSVNAIVNDNPVLNDVLSGINQNNDDLKIKIYSKDKNIIVNSSETAKQILIYNTLGTTIMTDKDINGLKSYNMNNYPNEFYIVKVVTNGNIIARKILLK